MKTGNPDGTLNRLPGRYQVVGTRSLGKGIWNTVDTIKDNETGALYLAERKDVNFFIDYPTTMIERNNEYQRLKDWLLDTTTPVKINDATHEMLNKYRSFLISDYVDYTFEYGLIKINVKNDIF